MIATTASSLLQKKMLPKMILASSATTSRNFSSDCAPAQKLRGIFEEYRTTYFSDEVPSAFRNTLISFIKGPDNHVVIDNFNIILGNIGRQDAYLSDSEIRELLLEAGVKGCKIPVEQAMQLL